MQSDLPLLLRAFVSGQMIHAFDGLQAAANRCRWPLLHSWWPLMKPPLQYMPCSWLCSFQHLPRSRFPSPVRERIFRESWNSAPTPSSMGIDKETCFFCIHACMKHPPTPAGYGRARRVNERKETRSPARSACDIDEVHISRACALRGKQ